MRSKVAIIYNEPTSGRYEALGEKTAVLGVLEAVEAVHQALAELGYFVVRVPLLPPLENVREKLAGLDAELIFNLFEGFDDCPEAEAAVAYLLSELGLTYTGCQGDALSLALDKARAKSILKESGVDTPRYQLLDGETLDAFHLNYPCIVKPCAEDASHGISADSVVSDAATLARQVGRVTDAYGGGALVEEYIEGREFNATVLGNKAPEVLPISEIVYSLPPGMPRLLTFPSKWEPESFYFRFTRPVCPAEIEPDLHDQIADAAVSTFRLLGCSGYARVDFRLDAQGRPLVLEANPNCDISPTSGAARQARAAGMTYSQFVERIALIPLGREQS
jgi:D-alanine-D-alanine ligase